MQDSVVTLLDWEYFNLTRLNLKGSLERNVIDVVRLYSVLDGKLELCCEGENISISCGDSFLLPAGTELVLNGDAVLLEAFPK